MKGTKHLTSKVLTFVIEEARRGEKTVLVKSYIRVMNLKSMQNIFGKILGEMALYLFQQLDYN